MVKFIKKGLFLIVLIFTVSGCASFPDGEYKDYGDIKAGSDKPSVGYNVTFVGSGGGGGLYGGGGGSNDGKVSKKQLEKEKAFKNTLENVFDGSGYFSDVTEGPAKYHLSVSYEVQGMDAAVLTGLFSVYTLGILPYYNNEELIVKIDVHEEVAGKMTTLKTYKYKRNVKTWAELFLVFIASKHKPKVVKNDAVRNIFENFVYDLSRDAILAK